MGCREAFGAKPYEGVEPKSSVRQYLIEQP